jgi:hypothetical protein
MSDQFSNAQQIRKPAVVSKGGINGPKNFRSSAKRDFFNTIDPERTLSG